MEGCLWDVFIFWFWWWCWLLCWLGWWFLSRLVMCWLFIRVFVMNLVCGCFLFCWWWFGCWWCWCVWFCVCLVVWGGWLIFGCVIIVGVVCRWLSIVVCVILVKVIGCRYCVICGGWWRWVSGCWCIILVWCGLLMNLNVMMRLMICWIGFVSVSWMFNCWLVWFVCNCWLIVVIICRYVIFLKSCMVFSCSIVWYCGWCSSCMLFSMIGRFFVFCCWSCVRSVCWRILNCVILNVVFGWFFCRKLVSVDWMRVRWCCSCWFSVGRMCFWCCV